MVEAIICIAASRLLSCFDERYWFSQAREIKELTWVGILISGMHANILKTGTIPTY